VDSRYPMLFPASGPSAHMDNVFKSHFLIHLLCIFN
jgi:hypothetical protein